MTNILTAQQAANALRTETTDLRMLDLLPQVDLFIQRATGRDWTQDTTKNAVAVSAATMLLVQWFDNPSMIGDQGSLHFGLTAALSQLEAEALKYRKYEFEGISGVGSILLPGAREGDDVVKLVGIFNASGSQISSFESEVSEENYLKQISASDLTETIFVVVLKSPADDVDV
jgi:hypothetical protein